MSWKNIELPIRFGQRGKPNDAAIVDFSSTERGVLFPSMTTAQRDAIQNIPDGLTIFNISTHSLEIYDSAKTEWGGASGGGGVSKWLPTTDYETEDIIWYDEDFYKAVDDHTSGTTFAADAAHWFQMSDKLTAAEVATLYESNADTNKYDDAAVAKLGGIEDNATADQEATEIKSLYESNADTNEFTDSEKSKLSLLESSHFKGTFADVASLPATGVEGDYARVDGGVGDDVTNYLWDTSDNSWKQSGHAPLTDAEVKTMYEANADTNAYTDAEKTTVSKAVVDGGNIPAGSDMQIGSLLNKAVKFIRNGYDYLGLGNDVVYLKYNLLANAGIWMNNKRIQSLGAPTSDSDAATKKYVDDKPQTFIAQTDTPAAYAGGAGKVPTVNEDEDGLEFKGVPSAPDIYARFNLDGLGKDTDVTTVGSVTKSIEETTPLNGDKSLKIEFGAGVATDDMAIINGIVRNERCRTAPFHKCSFVYSFDGPKGSVDVVLKGNMPSEELVRFPLDPNKNKCSFIFGHKLDSFPTQTLRFVATGVEAASTTLIVDDVEFSDKAYDTGSVTVSETITYTGYDSIDGSGFVKFDTPLTDNTSALITHDNSGTYTKYTFKKAASFTATTALGTSTNAENTTKLEWYSKLGAVKKASAGRAEYYGQATISDIAEEGDYILVYTGFPSATTSELTNFSVTATAQSDTVQFEDSYQQGHFVGKAVYNLDTTATTTSTSYVVPTFSLGSSSLSGKLEQNTANAPSITIPNARNGSYVVTVTGLTGSGSAVRNMSAISDGSNYWSEQAYYDGYSSGKTYTIEHASTGDLSLDFVWKVSASTNYINKDLPFEMNVSYLPPVEQASTTRMLAVKSSLENDFYVNGTSTGILSKFEGAENWCSLVSVVGGVIRYQLNTDIFSEMPNIDVSKIGNISYFATVREISSSIFELVFTKFDGSNASQSHSIHASKAGADRSDRHTPVVNGDDVVFCNHKTTEFDTGETWIDGRTIYGRSFETTVNNSSGFTLATIDSGLEIVDNNLKIGADTYQLFPSRYVGSGDYILPQYTPSTGDIYIGINGQTLYSGWKFTIRYVK